MQYSNKIILIMGGLALLHASPARANAPKISTIIFNLDVVVEENAAKRADLSAQPTGEAAEMAGAKKEILELVRCLQSHGYQTPLFADTPGDDAETSGRRGVYAFFAPILFSYQIGRPMADERVLLRALEIVGATREEVVVVGSDPAKFDGRNTSGLQMIQFTDTPELVRQLSEKGVHCNCAHMKIDIRTRCGFSPQFAADMPPGW